jgi:hypothetical protein
MYIQLDDNDISKMPESLQSQLLDWLPEYLKTKNSNDNSTIITSLATYKPTLQSQQLNINFESQNQEENAEHSRIRLSQLFDAGITKKGMTVRVRLTRENAKKLDREYINSLEISATGTIVYNGQEFDAPSPLAVKVNEIKTANGWEYVEVKRNDQWISLDELRKIWRKSGF